MRTGGDRNQARIGLGRVDDALFKLEWRAYRTYLPKDAASWTYWVLSVLALIVGSLIFMGDMFAIEAVFALGAMLTFLIALYMGGGMAMTVWENGFRQWWIGLPVPRRALVRAKVLAACAMQGIVACSIWIACIGHALVRWAGQDDTGAMMDGGRLVSDALAFGLLFAMLIPLGVSAGYSLLGMYYGWRRWLLPLWLVLFVAPFILFGVVPGGDEASADLFDPGRIVMYACACAALAAGAYRVCQTLVSKYGIRDLAQHRPGSAASLYGKRERAEARLVAGRIGTGFAAIYALERSRYRYWTSLKTVRILYACLLLLAGIGGYFGARDPHKLMDILRSLLVIPCIVPVLTITVTMTHEANKRRMEWWLGLPYSRARLLLARYAAVWVSVFQAVGGLLALLAAGIALNGREALSYFSEGDRIGIPIYLFTVYGICGLLVSALGFTHAYTMRSVVFSLLYVPISFATYFLPGMLGRWVITDALLASRVDAAHWTGLAVAAAAAIAIAPLCFRVGAKWTHLYLFNTTEARQRKRGEQSFKFRS